MLTTVEGYPVKNMYSVHVVSVLEGRRIRQASLKADRSRIPYGREPYVNPDTYNDEEKKFMEEAWMKLTKY